MIENKDLQRTEALYDLTRALISSEGLPELLQAVVHNISRLLPADNVILITLDVEQRQILDLVQSGPHELEGPQQLSFDVLWDGLSGWVIREGEPALSNKAARLDPREGSWARSHRIVGDTGAVIVVPLQYHEATLGTLTAVNRLDQPDFTEADVALMSAMANQAAAAIASARLFDQAQQSAREQALISRAMRALNTLDIEQVYPVLVDILETLTECQRVTLTLFDAQHRSMRIIGGDAAASSQPTAFPISRGEGYQQLQAGEAHFVPDLGEALSTAIGRELYEAGLRSTVMLPLIIGGKLSGFLGLGSERVQHFDQDQIPILQQIADAVAIAVENHRLLEAERRQRELAERLQETALVVNTLDLDEVLDLIMDQLSRLFPYQSGSIQILEHGAMHIIAARNLNGTPIGRHYPLDRYPYNRRLANGETIVIHDVQADDQGWVAFDEVSHVRSNIGVPLWVRDRVIGALTIDSLEARAYTERDVRVVQAFAQQAAVAIENARLFEAQREQRELAEALSEAATVMTSALDIDQVLDHVLEQVSRVVNGDTFHILLIEGEEGRVIRQRGYERFGITDVAREGIPIFDYPYLAQMIERGEPIVIPDIEADPNWVSRERRGWRRSYMAAPIRIAGKTEGFLNVNGARPHQFGPEDARRLNIFADHAAIALQNARLFQMALQNAEDLGHRVRERTVELEAKTAWLEAILSSTSDGIIVTDGDGHIVQANRVARDWLNHALSVEDAAVLRETVRDLAHRVHERPDAVIELTGLDLELSASPISEQGQPGPAVVVAIHDVSYLKALDRMKSQFVSNVSHELRTPITSIRLYSSLIQKSGPEHWDRYFEALDQEAERLVTLVEDILQISRIEAGRLELKREKADLNLLTCSIVSSREVLAASRGLSLACAPQSTPVLIYVDIDKITQVLNNLIENAIYYTLEGGRIDVSTAQVQHQGKAWAVAKIVDTGIGISAEESDHLFERFFRGAGPQQMQIQGSGLGLTIVKEITELHGGKVTVESEIGEGSTFSVWLPLWVPEP